MPLRPYILILLVLLFGLVPGATYALPAGQMSGVLLYGTSHYRAEVDGKEEQRAKSMYEQISLRYKSQGLLGDARVGRYTLMLGYEFSILDPTISYQGVKDPAVERIETGKPFYEASVVLAPGGLPFRLTAYTRDIHQTAFNEGGRFGDLPLGLQSGGQSSLLAPRIFADISNGTHREIGATLLVGIRNGSYLGAYRDVLSQLPRLLVDYKQIDVRDLSSDFSMANYRSRDLAFVSLNKKDNWVHLRTHDFVDYLDSRNNTTSSQVMIGTVDHYLVRQWINLTNWIKISSDFSLTVDKRSFEPAPEETYNGNIFAISQRERAQMTVFSSFTRTTQGANQSQGASLPVYFSYNANRDSFYRGSLNADFSRSSLLDSDVMTNVEAERNSRNVSLQLGADLFRSRTIGFRPNIILEASDLDGAQSFAERVDLEWLNRRGSSGLMWNAAASLAATQSDSSRYLEKTLRGSVEKNLNSRLRAGVSGSLTSGSGTSSNMSNIQVANLQMETTDNQLNNQGNTGFLAYNLRTFLDHAGEQFSNRLEFITETIKIDSGSITAMRVEHMLRQRRQNSEFSLTSTLMLGDNVSVLTDLFDYVRNQNDTVGLDRSWASKAEYSYTPDRRIRFSLTGNASGSEGGNSNNQTWRCEEKLDYRIFTINGIVRKLAEVSEEIGWERVAESADGRNRAVFLRLSGAIYPTKYLYAKVASEVVAFGPGNSEQVKLGGETGMNFEKMQVALSYARGYKAPEGTLAEVKEERWDLKVRKTF